MARPSSSSSLGFASVTDVYGPGFGIKGRGGRKRGVRSRARSGEGDDVCVAAAAAAASGGGEEVLGAVMERYLASGTRAGAEQEEGPSRAAGPAPRDVVPVPAPATHLDRAPRERDPEGGIYVQPSGDGADPVPATAPVVADLRAEQQNLLDVVLFVFGGVILIFAMEQMVQLGIQLGARDGL